jgi:predicted PurR-regulated permease PerM
MKEKNQNNWEVFRSNCQQLFFSRDFLVTVFLLAFFFLFVSLFRELLFPFFASFVLAYLLNPVVKKLHRRFPKMQRAGIVIWVFLSTFLLSLLFIIPFAIQLSKGVFSMADEITQIQYKPLFEKSVNKLREWKTDHMPDSAREYVDDFIANLNEYQQKIEEVLKTVNSWLGKMLKLLGNLLVSTSNTAFKRTMDLILLPILLFYMLIDFDSAYRIFMKIVPPGYKKWVHAFAGETDITLRNFIRGQMLVAACFGIMMTIGLYVIGIKFWLVLGPLSGIANLIPYLGVIFGLGPALLLAVYQGALPDGAGVMVMIIKVIILFSIVQTIDGLVLQPKIIGENVELHPLIVMLALLIGAELMGVYGMLFAVPVAAILKVLIMEIYNVLYIGKSKLLYPTG